jgi:hypothetical protein
LAEIVLRSDDRRALALGIDLDEFPEFDVFSETDVASLEEEIRRYLEEKYG